MTILDGKIDIGTGLVIEPRLTEAQFLSSFAGTAAMTFTQNGIYHSYKIQNMDVEGKNFLILIYFADGILTEVQLHPEFIKNNKWAAYSSKDEVDNKLSNDSWLQKTIGAAPPYVFSWGSIESVLDKKSCMTFILLRYKKLIF